MLSITDGEALARALNSSIDNRLKQLLRLRCTQLRDDQPDEDIADMAHFAIVQVGDTPADLRQAIGFSILESLHDNGRFGDPGWSPDWEWIEDHGFAWELCYIMDDSGFGHVIILPNQQGIAPELVRLCRTFSPARV